jgi:hypothetical protein
MFCAARISAAHASEVVTLTKQRDHEAEQCDRYRKLASESASEVERLRELSGAQDRLLRSAVIERDEARSRLKAVTAERDEAWELLKVREDNEEHELARELAMARSQLQRAVGLLYEEAKNTLCIEAPAGGQLGQTYCAGDCWNCRVRAFLTSLPLPQEGAPSTPEGTRDDGIR